MQGFIQALLLTSVFHEGLSFMTVGDNPTCISTLVIATGGSYMRCCNPSTPTPLWGPGAMPLKALAITPILCFQIAFPYIIW